MAKTELDTLMEQLDGLDEDEFESRLADAHGITAGLKWLPNPGPQTDAYLSEADVLLYGGAPGGGKMTSLNTRLLMPSGWTTMGEIRVGDQVFDENGLPCNVIAKSEIDTTEAAYKITFSDGSIIEAGERHQWVTSTRKERQRALKSTQEYRKKRQAKRPSRASGTKSAKFTESLAKRNSETAKSKNLPTTGIRTTREIYETLLGEGGRLNHSVAVCKPLKYPSANLLIDPYVLGAWLGDGTTKSGDMTGIDEEIYENIAKHYPVTRKKGTKKGYIKEFVGDLKYLNIYANKDIPDIYLRGSIEQRLSLLQGLMDTDGTCDTRGQCEFTQVRKHVAEKFLELIHSLGIKATMREGLAKLNGMVTGPNYRIKFMTELPVFRLPRKIERQKTTGFRGTHDVRYIQNVEKIPNIPMQCIEVDSPNKMYLVGRSLIPTHNSQLILGLAFNCHKRTLIMRRKYSDLGRLIEDTLKIHGSKDGFRGSPPPRLQINKDQIIDFGAAQYVGDEQSQMGKGRDLLCVGKGTMVIMGDSSKKEIQNIVVGDLVSTLEGPKKVTKVWPVRKDLAVKVTANNNGTKVSQVQSLTHSLLLSSGWASFDTLSLSHQSCFSLPTEHHIFYTTSRLSLLKSLLFSVRHVLKGLGRQLFLKQAPSIQGLQDQPVISSCISQPKQGNAFSVSCASYLKKLRHSLLSYFAKLLRWNLRMARILFSFSINLLRDRSYALSSSSLANYQDYYSCYNDLYDAQPPSPPRLYLLKEHGLICPQQLADAGQQSPIYFVDDGLAKTPKYTSRKEWYSHPYTKEKRRISENYHILESSFNITPVGIVDLYDIEVETCNHYITLGGFVNKNCIDEATHFAEVQIRFLMGWNRTDDPNQRVRTVLATNPPLSSEGLWVIQMFAPWLDPSFPNPAKPGELRWVVSDAEGKDKWVDGPGEILIRGKMVRPKSRTYIPSQVSDNPYYAKTDYERELDNMPEPYRSLLLGGFQTSLKDAPLQLIPTSWIKEAMARWTPDPPDKIPMCSLAADVARGGDAETTLARRYGWWFDKMISIPGKQTPTGGEVAGAIVKYRRDECAVIIDMGGGYGGSAYDCLKQNGIDVVGYLGSKESTAKTKEGILGFYNKRAEVYWKFKEALDPGQPGGSPVMLPDDPILMADLCAPQLDMNFKGVKIESKDKLIKTLGRSPDRGDAVVMAWAYGANWDSHAKLWIEKRKKKQEYQVIRKRRY